jgi:glutathione synthase
MGYDASFCCAPLMEFAFVVDPLPLLQAYKDSSIAMMRELARRGHAVFALEQSDLFWEAGATSGRVQHLDLFDDDHTWYSAGAPEVRRLASFDAVLMRKDPPFDMEYLYSTYLLECAEREGARVFNRPRALRDHNEKMAITQFEAFIAPTLVTRDAELIRGFIDRHLDVIVKPLDGMGGSSIFRVGVADPNRNVIIETVSRLGRQTVMVQKYLPEIVDGDKRVLVIGGEVVPYALARIPKPGETRGNLAAGGRGEARPVTPREQQIATALAPQLWAAGLLVVGLDIIGPCLTEVNVTSPTCFVEITEQTGFDVPGMFADALLAAVAA